MIKPRKHPVENTVESIAHPRWTRKQHCLFLVFLLKFQQFFQQYFPNIWYVWHFGVASYRSCCQLVVLLMMCSSRATAMATAADESPGGFVSAAYMQILQNGGKVTLPETVGRLSHSGDALFRALGRQRHAYFICIFDERGGGRGRRWLMEGKR